MIPKYFLLDVDGVMTSGHFVYSRKGKEYKIFGPDDHDALKLLQKFIKIEFVTSDLKGFSITKKRIKDDMGFPIHNVTIKKKISIKIVLFNGNFFFAHMFQLKIESCGQKKNFH